MKRNAAFTWLFALGAAPAAAERIVLDPGQIHATPMTGAVVGSGGTLGSGATAVEYLSVDLTHVDGGRAGSTVVYSNNPALGTSTLPSPTIGGVPNTWLFLDWVESAPAWADYVTLTQSGRITGITWSYFNGFGVHTQSIIIGVGPPIPTMSGPFTGIGVLATVIVPTLPDGVVSVAITGLDIPVGTSSIYIGYEDAFGVGPGTDHTFWLTGGFPTFGSSEDSVAMWVPGVSSYAAIGPFVAPHGAAHLNTVQTIVMPEPGTIALLAAGGLLVLRRRRAG